LKQIPEHVDFQHIKNDIGVDILLRVAHTETVSRTAYKLKQGDYLRIRNILTFEHTQIPADPKKLMYPEDDQDFYDFFKAQPISLISSKQGLSLGYYRPLDSRRYIIVTTIGSLNTKC